jgi:hypothetical protein
MAGCFRIALFAAVIAMGIGTGYAQENVTNSTEGKPVLKWISGSVAQVAFVKSFLMVITELGYITFNVTDDTSIMMGSDKTDLTGIDTEDMVRIQYFCPEPGKYTAVSISKSRKYRGD